MKKKNQRERLKTQGGVEIKRNVGKMRETGRKEKRETVRKRKKEREREMEQKQRKK